MPLKTNLKIPARTRGYKTHKRLIINPIVKRFGVKKDKNTEGGKMYMCEYCNSSP